MKRNALEHPSSQPPCGFTLIELLLTVAIIAILITLLIPAVDGAREAARRAHCSNNLKQLSVAVLNYESAFNTLPPSSTWKGPEHPLTSGASDPFNVPTRSWFSENWVIMVLPYLEQQSLYDAFDLNQYIRHANNQKARGTPLPVMTCPADPRSRQPFNGSGSTPTNTWGDGWARGNYGANASMVMMNASWGSRYPTYVSGGVFSAGVVRDPNNPPLQDHGWNDQRVQGVMGANWSLRLEQIHDGASNTIMLGEMRTGIVAFDPRGVWAMGGPASSLWAHGNLHGDMVGPNSTSASDGDNLPNCRQIAWHFGCASESDCPPIMALRMSCYHGFSGQPHNQSSVGSGHLGGAVTAMCDGSVRFISEWIDADDYDTAAPASKHFFTNPTVWTRLNVAADGFPVDGEAF